MKKTTLYIMFVCLFVSTGLASYTYEVYAYGSSKSLSGNESILVADQGGMYGLTLFDNSLATIEGTSTIGQGTGGIWILSLSDSSNVDVSGGGVHLLDLGNDATATLSGGLIEAIWSSQIAWKLDYGFDPPQWVPNPHITIKCNMDYELLYTGDAVTGVTGTWLDGSEFMIGLHNVSGYSPVIDNIQFIPEPATLLLVGAGGLLLRKRRC